MSWRGRVAHPSQEERRKWALFVAEAEAHAAATLAWKGSGMAGDPPSAERFAKARRRAKNARLPENQQRIGSPLHRLVKLADEWPTLSLAGRVQHAPELLDLARLVEAELNPKRRERADIDG